MQAQVINSSPKEINLSITESDVATLYIIQHELLKESSIDFAGVIVKHPLTNECWMRVNTSKSNPIKEITKASESAIKISEDLKKLFNSKIK
ncbi:MAG TPA: RpoL/Rpb11 RNA polymerase subunit family protein [Nitrosopumilaceae archaeon]|nr:RpoL/Rpb11 RNA polymerase subunit family protein [Nitrosopumilaceae archaeon]